MNAKDLSDLVDSKGDIEDFEEDEEFDPSMEQLQGSKANLAEELKDDHFTDSIDPVDKF